MSKARMYGSLLGFLALLAWIILHGCGGSASPERQVIRTAASIVASLCPAQVTVSECVDLLDKDEERLEQFVRPSDAGAE